MITINQINEISDKIANHFNPDKIILIGSYASGTFHDDSDLDFLIIKDSDLPKHKRSKEIYKLFIGMKIPMDILVYSNKEYNDELNIKFSFINSALKTSKILYERKS